MERLARDTAATAGNVRASAELRQAVANTKLQRVMICLTVLAVAIAVIGVVVAVISLYVASHAADINAGRAGAAPVQYACMCRHLDTFTDHCGWQWRPT